MSFNFAPITSAIASFRKWISGSPSAPIQKLPPELLVEIFSMHWSPFDEDDSEAGLPEEDPSLSFREELEHLAHAPLLDLSTVCSQWHSIILGTPSLWRKIRLVGSIWSDEPEDVAKVMQLLNAALARSNRYPLTLVLSGTEAKQSYATAVQLLASSSERWKSLTIRYDGIMVAALSSIEGHLPRLESLFIEFGEGEFEQSALDVFSSTPALQILYFYGLADGFSKFPLRQLTSLTCLTISSVQIPDIVALTPSLRDGASLTLEMFMMDDEVVWELDLEIIPATSSIGELRIDVDTDQPFAGSIFKDVLGSMFSSLTLPLLETMQLNIPRSSQLYQGSFPWPSQHFLALSQRSSFSSHLLSLFLIDLIVTEAELVECLHGLQALESLSIGDHDKAYSGTDHHLITDSLLTRLTRTDDSDSAVLIPRLRFFTCRSSLEFSDSKYYECICSRASSDDVPEGCFESDLVCLYDPPREQEAVTSRVDELCAAGRLKLQVISQDTWLSPA
ncbi:hypothetical protein FB45DRAFT_789564 [Roridomyces roridus]|uniref:F-box domain-containing protein n=1 Tax=Roridomyces roridus TaxID=1738132 RepID=A0AAD7BYS6_9AGAR|nr:hypothetical protein FB45DRAFT_789564 [Roridomyces roridus]